ncbi:aldehyde dehydrogenase [Colletotrichum godetiae]|uniref:aldehyde dehydrogenase (NAD(+)) n=1 Tax=Colletotrichum godetiae TaxID=1209918 RepID=A0AAJ0A6X2_9PEZI|nr:aldehyde dehydrogenase [Colletotrichum godetiae]KAK1657164.1 aldehyde dehydrogenase [Colletotrichum godetiae]
MAATNSDNFATLSLSDRFVQIINGKASQTEKNRHGINPANLRAKAEVPIATRGDLDLAVAAAKDAFKGWSKVPYEDRKKAVLAYADAVDSYRTQFRDLLISEQGKPIPQADAETDAAISWIRGMANIPLPEDVVEDNDHRTIITRYAPLGVVGAIVPWNFPLLLATGKIAPALLTGNVIIVKPSPFTPYCGLKLSLSGDDDLGPWLTSHPGIDKISFTGSTATGKLVMQSASKTLKRVTLELGGNDPAIVFPDVDVDKVAEKGYNLGDGSQPGVTHGPLQNSMQYERVKTFFSDIESQGWKVAVGGSIEKSQGYFITPTIIDRPPEKSRLVVEEPFGPIVPLLSWSNEDEVISRANDTSMGLGASVWSNNLDKAARVARQIQAGNVWINTHFDLSPLAPFGGHKESGIGTEWGANGLKGFCNVQTLFLNKQVVS